MSNITKSNSFSLTPTSLEEAMKFAEIMAKSSIVPKQYQGKPGDILIAVQMGADLGLKPMQALQNIAVINGRPCIWGDALLALVQSHPHFEDIKETVENGVASCTVKRKGQTPHTVTFSIDDAKKAALWNKSGPWTQYPNRMLALRARGFALRDRFSDALGGLITAEEAQDYPITEAREVTPIQEVAPNKAASLSNRISSLVDDEDNKATLVAQLIELRDSKSAIEEGVTKMLEKLSINDINEMNEEQLTKAVAWAQDKSGVENE